jgi:TRAP-type mannitol/chloroaromatic compound transport system permease small subunit
MLSDRQPGLVSGIDTISRMIGSAASWLTLAMVLVTVVIVLLRYAFEFGVIWLQESLTWMHAVVFMLGAAFTLQRDEHVRVDIFYRRMNPRQRGLVDAVGVLLFVFPLCGFIGYQSWGYVAASWSMAEVSVNTGGLPYPFVPLLKTVLLIMPVAVALQGLSILVSSLLRMRDT